METSMQIKILSALKKTGNPFQLTVTGYSMNPVLFEGDIIIVSPDNDYNIGDILVFAYNQNNRDELLIHRLLEIKDGMYYCKGDNALRMEKTPMDKIFGKVSEIKRNGENIPVPLCTEKLIIMSKAVNTMFFKRRYDSIKTRETYIYKIYNKIFIDGEDIKMYVKNEKLDYINTDDISLAVFNPESGDTHFLDETATDILQILEQPHDFDALIEKLCGIYDAGPEEIREDVMNFLKDAAEKRIVVEL